jgi:protease PrsW
VTTIQSTRRWAWVGTFVVGAALYLAVLAVITDTDNPNLFPTLILLGALVVPLTFVTFAAGRSGRWVVDETTLGIALLFGGVIGVVVAGLLEYDAMLRLDMLPMIAVGLIEEGAKLIVPLALVIFAGRRYRSVGGGIVIGIAVGTGFAVLETMGYAFVALIDSGGNVGAAEQTLLVRGLLSPAGHAAWTGLTCWGLWMLAVEPSGRRLLAFAGLFALAVALHTTWDSLGGRVTYAVVGAISIGLLLIALRQAQRLDMARPVPVTAG